jgi:aspartate racemase
MKKIGIVGGVAWPSTVDYYTEICRRSAPSTPEISIESLDLNKAVAYIGVDGDEESWTRFDEYHRTALLRLEASGADFALIASNSPHHRFATIVRGVRIPVISIFDAVARESARIGVLQVLILGTSLTMRSPRLREEFAKHAITAAGPKNEAAIAATIELIADLQLGKLDAASTRLAEIVKTSIHSQVNVQPTVCLACTELPLAFPTRKSHATFEHDGVLYINSAAVHIKAALELAIDD